MATGARKNSAAERQRECCDRKRVMQQKQKTKEQTVQQCRLYKKHAENQQNCRQNRQQVSQYINEKEKPMGILFIRRKT